MSHNKRPEHTAPPEIYYNDKEALKYTSNSHIIEVQSKLAERALELLALPEEECSYILDIGCGSGLSGETLSEHGHTWIGIDISLSMLNVARERNTEADILLGDIGTCFPFRNGVFDGAISISAVQWLFNAERSDQNPIKRLKVFFSCLYSCLSRGSRAVLQCYPETTKQLDLLQTEAIRAGFTGGFVIDFPNSTRAKKYFMVLDAGPSRAIPPALSNVSEENTIGMIKRKKLDLLRTNKISKQCPKKSSAWIKHKKDVARQQMRDVAQDSKYTGRKRRPKF